MLTSSCINEARVYDPDDRPGSWSYEESEHGAHALYPRHANCVTGRCRYGRGQAPFHVATLVPRPPALLQSLPVEHPPSGSATTSATHAHNGPHRLDPRQERLQAPSRVQPRYM